MRPNRHADDSAQTPVLCAWTQERLFDYLDGDLTLDEKTRAQAHLESCAACRREMEQTRRSERALASALQFVPPPGDMRSDFYARLAASEAQQKSRSWRFGWTLALPTCAAALLAIALLRPTFVSHSTEPPGTLAEALPETAPPDLGTPESPPTRSAKIFSGNGSVLSSLKARKPSESPIFGKGEKRPLLLANRFVGGNERELVERKEGRIVLKQLKGAFDMVSTQSSLAEEARRDFAERKSSFKADAHFGRSMDLRMREEAEKPSPLHSSRSSAMSKQEALSDRESGQPAGTKETVTLAASLQPTEYETDLKVQNDIEGYTASTHEVGAMTEEEDGSVVRVQAETTPPQE